MFFANFGSKNKYYTYMKRRPPIFPLNKIIQTFGPPDISNQRYLHFKHIRKFLWSKAAETDDDDLAHL